MQFFPQFFKFKILSFFEFCRKILLTFSCCSPNCLLLVFMFEFSHVDQISEISLQATFTPKFKLIRESKESSNSSCFHFLLTSYMLRIFWGSYIFHIWFWNFKISLCVCLYFACSRLKLREQFLIFSDFSWTFTCSFTRPVLVTYVYIILLLYHIIIIIIILYLPYILLPWIIYIVFNWSQDGCESLMFRCLLLVKTIIMDISKPLRLPDSQRIFHLITV